ncbi:hypothetical protein FRACYDRAFT_252548 [Fragilariopsis cylindrus CCMP1102]|uniref:MYND-type domain-containing protein n=1 Tax=Fragilariopsis cylindrus CCMP1102 TaxID=635003 RepID=A0A1E7ELW6_9STRA|nr:hypothetical protein FRACYDRAFT_252548 [Fragilariopsis cylindrus CCMP1102]|eukprot:OEU06918.1 hypothetical protein FRACYDRAFT_252548 [Fragilariopsis cylindrus CCMP1102]
MGFNNTCLACSKECSLQCSDCRVVHFCNRECQKSAWKHHKAFCKSVTNPAVSSHNKNTTDNDDDQRQTCVIIDGFGPCGANWDDTIKSREQLLLCGMDVIYINGTKGGSTLPVQVASLLLQSSSSKSPPPINALLFWGFGSGGDDVSDQKFYESSHFKAVVISWCANGGRFIVQGERTGMMGNWPMWFDKQWKDSDYYRTDHKCFAVSAGTGNDDMADADFTAANHHHWCKWYKESDGAVVSTYNVKACMLENVDPTEVLFGTTDDSQSYSLVPSMSGHRIEEGKTAVAFGKYGSGTVSFFGDVNHEHATIQIMTVIARGEATTV